MPLRPIARNATAPPEQQIEEHRAARDPGHRADGNLVGKADEPAEDIAGQHQPRSARGDPAERAAQIVAHQPRHDVGHGEADERDHADDHDGERRDDGDDDEADLHHPRIVDAEADARLAAERHDRQAVSYEKGGGDHQRGDPQEFVAPPQHAGKLAVGPDGEKLQEVRLPGGEGGDRADDPAIDDAEERHEERLLGRQAMGGDEEDRGAGKRRAAGDERLHPERGGGKEQRDEEDAEFRALGRAGRRPLDEAVARKRLHDEPGGRQPRAAEHGGKGARQAADEEELQRLRIAQHRAERQRADADGKAEHKKDREPEARDPSCPWSQSCSGWRHLAALKASVIVASTRSRDCTPPAAI